MRCIWNTDYLYFVLNSVASIEIWLKWLIIVRELVSNLIMTVFIFKQFRLVTIHTLLCIVELKQKTSRFPGMTSIPAPVLPEISIFTLCAYRGVPVSVNNQLWRKDIAWATTMTQICNTPTYSIFFGKPLAANCQITFPNKYSNIIDLVLPYHTFRTFYIYI